MPIPSGRSVPLSVHRRLLTELMHFAQQMPAVTMDRRMCLGPLLAARRACPVRPSWTTLFMKAFALVAERRPELRRTYLPYPWPHFYEHPESVAACTVEREDDGEVYPLALSLHAPERRPIGELDLKLRQAKVDVPQTIPEWRRSRRIGRLPWPLRRLAMWALLNLSGRVRAHHIGTFAVSSPAADGAGILHILSVVTSTLHYGLLEGDETVPVRLTVDHRVYDGAPAARVLTELESVLNHEIAAELLRNSAVAA